MLESPFTDVECRILGCLMEKQHTTPDYYPLTLNALVAACNQTSNRHPLVAYSEQIVSDGLESLRHRQLVWVVSTGGSRTIKYEQRLTESLHLSLQETALLCVLMLRGPQTLGELRGRSERDSFVPGNLGSFIANGSDSAWTSACMAASVSAKSAKG